MSLASRIAAKTRKPTIRLYLDGRLCTGVISASVSQAFGQGISAGTVVLRNPPVTPTGGMSVFWEWGYDGFYTAGFNGEISNPGRKSYPNRWTLQCKDKLQRADLESEDIATDPLNDIAAKAAVEQILARSGITRMSIPTLNASGSAWVGSEWILGRLTPVSWSSTTGLKAAQDICSVLGYWLYCDQSGTVRATQMERRPSDSPFRTFKRGIDILVDGSPERQQPVDSIKNRVVVLGANTGVQGAQIRDEWQTEHPLLPSGVYRTLDFSSFLIEYVNESEAGDAAATAVAKRLVRVHSRQPNIVSARIKADPRIRVGTTIAIQDSGIGYSSAQSFFVYSVETSLNLQSGAFDQQLTLDGGTGDQGYTTIPPPVASFTWTLRRETLDGVGLIEVFLDGSGSVSLAEGEIVSWTWSTAGTLYVTSPTQANPTSAQSGPLWVYIFPASETEAEITLTVMDTSSKTGTVTQTVTLAGDELAVPTTQALSVAFGAAWAVTPDGGTTWNSETDTGDAIAVAPIGAGIDPRAPAGSAATAGIVATRGSGGTGLRGSLDLLATHSTNLASIGTAIACIWQNEANPLRVWVGAGDTVYRSIDGGATFTAMAKPAAGTAISWIIEDPALDNSVFAAVGANLYHATAPESGWAVLYAGPVGATLRQFVRSRDGQVTWCCFVGTFTGDAAQRVETGTGVTFPVTVTEVRTLALDKDASSLAATLYLIDAADPAQIFICDGLTGTSCVQSSQTFPVGATAMHALADPNVPLLYTADFDSVAAGTGAVRKYFPQPDLLLLFKEGDTGLQAHMLGLAAAGAISLAARVYLLPEAATGAGDKIFWLDTATGIWSAITPPQASWVQWSLWISPFNRDHLLLFGNDSGAGSTTIDGGSVKAFNGGAPGGDDVLYVSFDNGATWNPIELAGVTESTDIGPVPRWSHTTAGEIFVGGESSFEAPSPHKTWQYWRGPATSSSINATLAIDGKTFSNLAMGVSGEVVLGEFAGANEIDYLTNDGDLVANGTAGGGTGSMERAPGVSRAVALLAADSLGLHITTDYRTVPFTSRTNTAAQGANRLYHALAVAQHGVYVAGSGSIHRYVNAFSSDPLQEVNTVAGGVSAVATDYQSGTVVAAYAGSSVMVTTDGISWTSFPLPPDATALRQWIAVSTQVV